MKPTKQRQKKKTTHAQDTQRRTPRQQHNTQTRTTGDGTEDKTRTRNERSPTSRAHTSVPSDRVDILRDPEKLPSTPYKGDLKHDIVLQDLQSNFTKNEDTELPSPDFTWTPLAEEIRHALHRTKSRPYGAVDFRYVQVSALELKLVKEWRPILAHHDGLRGFAQRVIHGKRDQQNAHKDYIPIPADSIRAAFGLKPQRSGKQLGAFSFLWAYKCFVDPNLRWSKYKNGRCRRITEHGTPEEIMEEATNFFHDRKGKKRVLFMKGDVSRPTKTTFRNECFEKMDEKRRTAEEAEITPPKPSQHMIDYLNVLTRDAKSSGRSIYGECAKNVDDAVEVLLEKAEVGSEVYNKGIRQSITQLRRFQDMPYILYQAGGYTPRPTPVGGNHLVGVDAKAIPPLLGDRHVSLDLSKAQLAMFVAVAEKRFEQDMSLTKAALDDHLDDSTDFDLWESLTDSIEFPYNEVSKNAVKRGTYSTVFCAKENTILHNVSKEIAERSSHHYPEREAVRGFTDHRIIGEVLEARRNARRQLAEKVKNDPHTKDAFGRVLDLRDFRDGYEEEFRTEQPQLVGDETDSEVPEATRSMLAYIVQSLEVKTMWPIFKDAIQEHRGIGDDQWRILLYKYDEVILWSRDKRQTRRWAEKAIDLIDKQASKLVIKTRLDVEYAPWL